jgi:threonine/homoserine/homoserine lactone efflux protein
LNNLLAVLPLAVVMSAGPQIVTAILLATSMNAKRNSMAFVLGVTAATTTGVTIAYLLLSGAAPDSDSGNTWLDYTVVALLTFLIFRVFQHRTNTEPPAWMSKLQEATPKLSLRMGFLLYVVMPTDIICMITVGGFLSTNDEPWWNSLGFISLTALIAGLPLLTLLLMGDRADVILPKMRDWMTHNSWIVSEAVIVFFLLVALNGMR